MAKKTVYVSDLSGKAIPDGKGAQIRITFNDRRTGVYVIDATIEEGLELAEKGRKVGRRRRKQETSG